MKIYHRPELDYLSIDFKDQVESSSYFEGGVIVRLDEKKNVIGIDITDSTALFASNDGVSLAEACRILEISESTMRRKVKEKKIKFTKPNKKDYRFQRKDILKLKQKI